MISPYYFVPLNKEVFYPDWWDRISHDIPMKDSESGEIHIKVTAQKPMYIRNRYEKGDESHEVTKKENGAKKTIRVSNEFCHAKIRDDKGNAIGKRFYIPGSTLKGMSASVLRVLSFAEMNLDKKELGKLLSQRDMTPAKYCQDPTIRRLRDCPNNLKKDLFDKPMVATANGIGYLYKENSNYTIDDHSYIDNNGKSTIIKIKLGENREIYTAYNVKDNFQKKKDAFGMLLPKIKISPPQWNGHARAYLSDYSPSGTEECIVFNEYIAKKGHEFIIRVEDKKESKFSNNRPVEDVISDFIAVYFNTDNKEKNPWFERFDKGEKIPVFLQKSNKGNIINIGLSQLFKLPNIKTLLDAAKQETAGKLDLVKTMFGSDMQNPLKGRVTFGHLECNTIRYEPKGVQEEVLSSPKPTDYPKYIRQTDTDGNKVNRYTTLMDEESEISGWKFYPLQKGISTTKESTSNQEDDDNKIETQFMPLDKGVVFSGIIRYHNLKKEEIGALLSALTFHGNEATHHHVIGMAKPLGYGEISIEIEKVVSAPNTTERLFEEKEKQEYLDAFEMMMEAEIPGWKSTEQYTELLAIHEVSRAMALPRGRDNFYQQLVKPTGRKVRGKPETVNEFVQAKKDREYLRLFSELYGGDNNAITERRESASAGKPKNTQAHKQPTKKSDNKINSATPSPCYSISSTKMNKLISSIWHDKFHVNFQKNLFLGYKDKGLEYLHGDAHRVYMFLEKDPDWKTFSDKLYRFYKCNLSSDADAIALYKEIERSNKNV